MICGRYLATFEFEAAVSIEDQLGVVERTMVTFINAQHDHRIVFAGSLGHRSRFG
ncbi:hypothetical protein D3C80_2047740 [compost metagenome]